MLIHLLISPTPLKISTIIIHTITILIIIIITSSWGWLLLCIVTLCSYHPRQVFVLIIIFYIIWSEICRIWLLHCILLLWWWSILSLIRVLCLYPISLSSISSIIIFLSVYIKLFIIVVLVLIPLSWVLFRYIL